MAIQSSGLITLADIQTEFGGSNPIGLNEYYRNGAYVTANNTGVPTSGTISLQNFYGAEKLFYLIISSSVQNAKNIKILQSFIKNLGLELVFNLAVKAVNKMRIMSIEKNDQKSTGKLA